MASLIASGYQSNSYGGFIGGGQVGFNYQIIGNGIIGVEADIQGVAGKNARSMTAAAALFPEGPPYDMWTSSRTVSNNLSYIGTVRGRVGYLFTPSVLLFASGGLAYGGVNSQTNITWIGLPGDSFSSGGSVFMGNSGHAKAQVGWSAGGGAEWMFLSNWSAKAEYLFYDLGNLDYTTYSVRPRLDGTNFILSTNSSTRFNGNIARAGVNYHFNISPLQLIVK